jgi:hypothetical protein
MQHVSVDDYATTHQIGGRTGRACSHDRSR